jgi:hypothetical protein
MTEAYLPLVTAASSVLIAAMICFAALKAWRGWLELKRLELARRSEPTEAEPSALIELASVRERLRRLEAIANGVEL